MNDFQTQLQQLKVVPVLTPYTVDATLNMTEAMVAGGIGCVEITLRTPCAWEAIQELVAADLGIQIGIGTITTVALLEKALQFDPDFLVSPGSTVSLLDAAKKSKVPFLPGVATASEVMQALDYGFTTCKLFPAMAINGLTLLSSFAGPFSEVKFCPTGGVNADNAPLLLAQPNVVCVGGSWMIPKAAIDRGDWASITELSQSAMAC